MHWSSDGLLQQLEWSILSGGELQSAPLPAALEDLKEALIRYFEQGEPLGEISWQHLDQSAWTPFQRDVYRVLSLVPHGQTRTYGWIAARMGKPQAARAVGQALKKNPFPILIPCHRIQATQSLGGFLGAVEPERPELWLKRKLILLEEEYESPLFSFLVPESARGFSFGGFSSKLKAWPTSLPVTGESSGV
jgi:methylated-DNA-[protein]-cysteine S-methyltransferase